MNMTRVRVCCAIMLSWSLAAGPAFAQQPLPVPPPAVDPAPGFAVVPPANSSVYIPFDPLNTRWNLQTDVGNAIGWNSGFQTFSGFVPITIEQGRSILFIDTRLWAGFNNNIGNNIGVGGRYYSPALDRMFGVSGWWDHDDRHWATFDQGGISLESLGTVFDARANIYLPNSSQKILSQQLTGQAFCLQNFNIGLGQTSQVAGGLSGADGEIGGALPGLGDLGIRNYIGTYYYQGGSRPFWGVRQRNEVMFTENVQGQVSISSDPVFGTNVFGALNIMLPSGRPARAFSRQPTYERLFVPVQRDYRVHVQSFTSNTMELARRAGGQGGSGGAVGTPIVVWHVDNTAPAGGNGSEAHPFNFLPTTVPNNVDMILVARGDGTVTNMNHGITLDDNQRLLGEGIPHLFVAQQGTFVLPCLSPTGGMPSITNIAGNAVTLANNNEVSGFNIVSPTGSAVVGTNITNFNLNNLNITNVGAGGIQLTNATGIGNISDVSITNPLGNSPLDGILINNTLGGTLALSLDNVISQQSAQNGINLIAANGSVINSTFNNVTASLDNNGVALAATAGGQISVVGTGNNTFDSNVANGLSATATGGTVDLNFNSSLAGTTSMSNNGGYGLFGNATAGSIFNVALGNVTMVNNAAGGINLVGDASTMTLATSNNSIVSSNGGNGVNVALSNGSTFDGLIDSTAVNANALNGIVLNADASVANLTIQNNSSVNGNTQNGVIVGLTNGSTFSSALTDSTISGNGGSGYVISSNASASSLSTQNSQVNSNTVDGLAVTLANTSTFVGALDSTTFNSNGANGMRFTLDNSTGSLTATNGTQANLNTANGLIATLTNNSTFNTLFDNSQLNGNTMNGASFSLNNSSASFTAQNGSQVGAQGSGNGLNGLLVNAQNNSVFTTLFDRSIANFNTAGSGVNVTADNSLVSFTAQNNSQFNNNGVNGFVAALTNGTVMNALVDSSQFNNNVAGSGMLITSSNSISNLLIRNNSTFDNNALNGIQANLTNTSNLSASMSDSSASNNAGGNGFGVTADNSTVVSTITGTVTGTTSTSNLNGNGKDGANFTLTGGSTLNSVINGSSLSNNTNDGINYNVNASAATATLSNNLINGNGLNGIQVTNASGTFNSNGVTGNTISNNTGFGFLARTSGTGLTNLVIGGPTAALGNTFANNRNAGIGLFYTGTPGSAQSVDINHNTITGTGAGTDANATGQGIYIDQRDTTQLTANVRNNTIQSNTADGVKFQTMDSSTLTAIVDSNTIGGAGLGNGGDGIFFNRTGDAVVNGTVTNNTVVGNGNNGLEVQAQNGGLTFQNFTIQNNTFNTNGGDGIHLFAQAQADLNTTITNNIINGNTGNGIFYSENQFSEIEGNWSFNTITNNGQFGVNLSGNMGFISPLAITDSTISSNGAGGITLTENNGNPSGTINILRNQITGNSGIGVTLHALATGPVNPSITAIVNDNNITSNTGTGVDILGNGSSIVTVGMDNNTILTNGGRGVNILNDNNANMSINMTRNLVQSNASDGVFVVNGENYVSGGAPDLLFVMNNNNRVLNNGGLNSVGGLVLMEGTSDNGKMNADIENSTFSGNFGQDVYIQSFNSIGMAIPNPLNPPLARLDLQFRNNVVSILNVNPNPVPQVPGFAGQLANAGGVNLERLPVPTPGTGPSTFRVENDALVSNTIGATLSSFTTSLLEPYAATPYVWQLVPVGSLFP